MRKAAHGGLDVVQIVHSGIAELTEEQLVEQVAGEFLKDEWKRLTKGLPAWKVATILNGHMLGLDWRGSSKRDMERHGLTASGAVVASGTGAVCARNFSPSPR